MLRVHCPQSRVRESGPRESAEQQLHRSRSRLRTTTARAPGNFRPTPTPLLGGTKKRTELLKENKFYNKQTDVHTIQSSKSQCGVFLYASGL